MGQTGGQIGASWKDKNVQLNVADGNLAFLLNILPPGQFTFICTADLGTKIKVNNITSADLEKSDFHQVP